MHVAAHKTSGTFARFWLFERHKIYYSTRNKVATIEQNVPLAVTRWPKQLRSLAGHSLNRHLRQHHHLVSDLCLFFNVFVIIIMELGCVPWKISRYVLSVHYDSLVNPLWLEHHCVGWVEWCGMWHRMQRSSSTRCFEIIAMNHIRFTAASQRTPHRSTRRIAPHEWLKEGSISQLVVMNYSRKSSPWLVKRH